MSGAVDVRPLRWPAIASSRVAAAVATVLIASGLLHAVVLVVVGDPLSGPISFRKPASFGVSFGLTLLTVAVILDRTDLATPWRWAILTPTTLACVYEVGWVTVQRYRGVASHFAEGGVDETAFAIGGISIGVLALGLVATTVVSFTCLHEPPAVALGIRAGLVVLLLAQALGGAILAAADAYPPGLVRQQAVTGGWKLPHALAMHAVQVLPLLALVAVRQRPDRARTLVALATAGYLAVVVGVLVASPILQLDAIGQAAGFAVAALGLLVIGVATLRAVTPADAARR